jgi:CRP/FNR family transcriptional regulator, cyclic AMP receptor protein
VTLQKDVEVLRSIPLFAKIEPAKLKLLAFTSEHLEFAEGETLCRQGDPGDAAYIVLEGEADVLVETPGGPVRVAVISKNDIVGEIAILCDVPRTATVQATSRLVALRVSKDGFFNLVTQFPQIAVEVMGELASRLHQTTQRLTEASARLRTFEAAGAGAGAGAGRG